MSCEPAVAVRRPFCTRSGRFPGEFPKASTSWNIPQAWLHTQSYFTSTRAKAATTLLNLSVTLGGALTVSLLATLLEQRQHVHQAVLAAQRAAITVVAPGISRFDVDAAAREALEGAGMGEAFGHGTGHGLGIEIHEDPRVVQRRSGVDARDERIEAGMVFTVEPGAYFPGWGGVRIEDDILVTEHGAELLTNVSRDLLAV